MIKNKAFNFRAFTHTGLQNIALLAMAIYYITQFGMDLFVWKVMCANLAQDYCGYWSTAKIANEDGYAESYNIDKLTEIEMAIIPANIPLTVHGSPYLPVFIWPFQILNFLGPYKGYWVWTFISLILVISYLYFFTKSTTQQPLNTRLLFMMVLSLPFFQNLFLGQVNLWLTICIGEHVRATISGKPFAAGAWLAGLLLKPQYLVIICLVLLMQRYGKILAGFTVSSIAITGISFLMLGVNGSKAMLQNWLGLGTNNLESFASVMMNWRMVGVDLANHLGPNIAWMLAGIGAIATLTLTIYIWKQSIRPDTSLYVIALLGALSASAALAWHSNTASAVILIAPLIYLSQKPIALPTSILSAWVFLPPLANFIVFILAILFQAGKLPANSGDLLDFLIAVTQLAVNTALLVWAAKYFRDGKNLMVKV